MWRCVHDTADGPAKAESSLQADRDILVITAMITHVLGSDILVITAMITHVVGSTYYLLRRS